jgi:hypothetical protein
MPDSEPEFRVVPYRRKFAVEWYHEGGKRQWPCLGTDDLYNHEPTLQRFNGSYDASKVSAKSVTLSGPGTAPRAFPQPPAAASAFGLPWQGRVPGDQAQLIRVAETNQRRIVPEVLDGGLISIECIRAALSRPED